MDVVDKALTWEAQPLYPYMMRYKDICILTCVTCMLLVQLERKLINKQCGYH